MVSVRRLIQEKQSEWRRNNRRVKPYMVALGYLALADLHREIAHLCKMYPNDRYVGRTLADPSESLIGATIYGLVIQPGIGRPDGIKLH